MAVRPVPPKNIRLSLKPAGARVCFEIPRKKINGRPLDGLKGFRVQRVIKDLEGKAPPLTENLFFRLKKADWEQGTFCFEDRDLLSGRRYHYVIQAVRGWRCISDPAFSPAFSWHIPPQAPARLSATAGDGEVCLRWAPVKTFLDGTPVPSGRLRYRIYRYQGAKRVVLPRLASGVSFCDQGLANEKTYCYQVAAVFPYFGTLISGPLSPRACAHPEDRTPPRPPEGLVAVLVKGGVLLRWYRNGELDLAGYRVYRRRAGGPPQLLTKNLLKEPKYLDRSVPGPGVYYYWVTAVDSSPRANESAPSEEVKVKIRREKL